MFVMVWLVSLAGCTIIYGDHNAVTIDEEIGLVVNDADNIEEEKD